jgi:lactate permease
MIHGSSALQSCATGVLYPFFGTLLGWLGVALTGSDTASKVLLGDLQRSPPNSSACPRC